jgi:hypothetical protein
MDRYSLACVDMLMWEMVEAGPHSDGRDETDDDHATLAGDLTPVPFPRYPDEFGSQWYVSTDTILHLRTGPHAQPHPWQDEAYPPRTAARGASPHPEVSSASSCRSGWVRRAVADPPQQR